MKRFTGLILAFIMMIGFSTPAKIMALGTMDQIHNDSVIPVTTVMQLKNPITFTNGQKGYIDPQNKAVTPILMDNTTFIPIRAIIEGFGGEVAWEQSAKEIRISLNNINITMWIGKDVAYINGMEKKLDRIPMTIEGRTIVPVRFVAENLGLFVKWYQEHRIAVISSENIEDFKTLPDVTSMINISEKLGNIEKAKYEHKAVQLSNGTIEADIITVDLNHPGVQVSVTLPENKLNVTDSFEDIVGKDNTMAAINGNFFNAYGDIKNPVGHLMIDGEFIYGTSGLTAVGFTAENEIMFGKPGVFTKIKTIDQEVQNGKKAKEWTAYEVNVLSQWKDQSVMYTPARGSSVGINSHGYVMEVRNNTITKYYPVYKADTVTIPLDGYVLYFGEGIVAKDYFQIPEIGRKVEVSHVLVRPDEEGFDLDRARYIVSGEPRLVRNGQIDNSPLAGGFAGDTRFINNITPRTAIGRTEDGKLLLVSVKAASIAQLKELMLKLGSIDAVNLDGGGSTSMYYKGKFIRKPGRELTSVLLIHEIQ